MNLPLLIARRYLFARKRHAVINIISAVSALGVSIGTAALILILSVYNGFDDLVHRTLGDVEPDLLVTPAEGKVFVPEGAAFDAAYADPRIRTMCCTLDERVYLDYDGRQGIALARGVDRVYEEEAPLREHAVDGGFDLHAGDVPMAAVGARLAWKLNLSPRFLSQLTLYFPDREARISTVNPAASLRSERIMPGCLLSVNASIDNEWVVVPIETMRQLLGYEKEVSRLEIRLAPGVSPTAVQQDLAKALGPGFLVRDRFAQNESLYKMMHYEKLVIFLILLLVITVVSFNIYGCLSMLIMEKKEDIGTLHSLGATTRTIRAGFMLEGWFISLLGMAVGLVFGVGLALGQQHFGWVRMSGSFLVEAYPVVLSWTDVLLTAAGVALTGALIAWFPVHSGIRAS